MAALIIRRPNPLRIPIVTRVDGELQDLTNWVVTAGACSDPDVPPVKFFPLTVEVTDAVNGAFDIVGDTTDWPLGKMFYDFKYVTDSAQEVTMPARALLIQRSITP